MSSREFAEWLAYYRLEPFGWESENWRSGLIAAVIANTVRDPKKTPRQYQPEDFMPMDHTVDVSDAEPDRLRAKIDAAMVAFGGRVPRS